jgi:hypothetical protein
MFVVDHVLISDEMLDAPFACNLGACLGGCCVQGESGAPLRVDDEAEAGAEGERVDERELLEAALPVVRRKLTPEALATIEEQGVWEESGGGYATTCAPSGACVFVTYDGPVAKCSIQQAYAEGAMQKAGLDFPKPISCHLFPVRVARYGTYDVLNVETISLCAPAWKHGKRQGSYLPDTLRWPLTRAYGEEWYERFRQTWTERREALGYEPADPAHPDPSRPDPARTDTARSEQTQPEHARRAS